MNRSVGATEAAGVLQATAWGTGGPKLRRLHGGQQAMWGEGGAVRGGGGDAFGPEGMGLLML
jgi:hypothetical protein